eukprot:Opistho-1_new@78151
MMPTSSPARKLALTASTATRPPKRTVTSRASRSDIDVCSDNTALLRALLVARLVAAQLVTPLLPFGAGIGPPVAESLPAQRGQAARQVEHRQNQQQPQRHHVHLRRLQPQGLGQHAEHDGRNQRAPQGHRPADQRDQHSLETDEGVEHRVRVDVGPAHRHGRTHGARNGGRHRETGDLHQPRIHAQGLGALLVRAYAHQRESEAGAPHKNRQGHRAHRQGQHGEVDGVALGHHAEHPAHGAGDLLFEVGHGVADQLGHAEGQHRKIGAAQMQHRCAHDHRHHGGNAGAQRNRGEPGHVLQRDGAGVGADAEKGRGRQRQVAGAAAKQAPARGQRHIHHPCTLR